MSQVRIATHSDYQGMGYGRRAIELLEKYYEGSLAGLEEDTEVLEEKINRVDEEVDDELLSFCLTLETMTEMLVYLKVFIMSHFLGR